MNVPKFIQDFKPTILFLCKFVLLYLIANVVYGLYTSLYSPEPDPLTCYVTAQTSSILNALGYTTDWVFNVEMPTTQIDLGQRHVLSVYEGCNGINVMVIFVAFVIAFGHLQKKALWFVPLGLLLIHIANLGRLSLLFIVAVGFPDHFYFTHKYLFTALIYAMVLLLWVWWTMIVIRSKKNQ